MAKATNGAGNRIVGSVAGTFPISGNVGAIFTQTVLASAPTPIANGTIFDLIALALPVGNFIVIDANIWFSCSAGSTGANAWTSLTSATVPDVSGVGGITLASGTFNTLSAIAPGKIITMTSSGNLYLSGVCAFAAGSATASGTITVQQF